MHVQQETQVTRCSTSGLFSAEGRLFPPYLLSSQLALTADGEQVWLCPGGLSPVSLSIYLIYPSVTSSLLSEATKPGLSVDSHLAHDLNGPKGSQ